MMLAVSKQCPYDIEITRRQSSLLTVVSSLRTCLWL